MKLEDDLTAEETSREDEHELPQEARGLKDLWERDEEKESWDEHEQEDDDDADDDDHADEDEDEDENKDADKHVQEGDEDRDEMKRTSALLLQG